MHRATENRLRTLRRLYSTLNVEYDAGEEDLHRMRNHEEQQCARMQRSQKVMALELADVARKAVQEMSNQGRQLLRLVETGFSPEISEPCYLSRDKTRMQTFDKAQEKLQHAIENFVDLKVQKALSRASLTSTLANKEKGAKGITHEKNTTDPNNLYQDTTFTSHHMSGETEYNTLREDLQRLLACKWIGDRHYIQAKISLARSQAKDDILAPEVQSLRSNQCQSVENISDAKLTQMCVRTKFLNSCSYFNFTLS